MSKSKIGWKSIYFGRASLGGCFWHFLKLSKIMGYGTRIVSPRGKFHPWVEFAPAFGQTLLSVYMFNRDEILPLPVFHPCLKDRVIILLSNGFAFYHVMDVWSYKNKLFINIKRFEKWHSRSRCQVLEQKLWEFRILTGKKHPKIKLS